MKRTTQQDQDQEGNRTMLNQRTIFTLTHSFGRLARQAAMCTAVAALTACGGGSGGNGDMMIMPPVVEPPTTFDGVTMPGTETTVGSPPVRAEISPDEEHFFRFVIQRPSNLRVSTTGVETQFAAFDREENLLPSRRGSIIVTVTTDLIENKGGEVIIRVSSTETGEYTLASTSLPVDTASSTPPT